MPADFYVLQHRAFQVALDDVRRRKLVSMEDAYWTLQQFDVLVPVARLLGGLRALAMALGESSQVHGVDQGDWSWLPCHVLYTIEPTAFIEPEPIMVGA